MPKVLQIPKSLELKHPNRSKKQLRLILGMVIKSINIRLRTSHIVNFRVKGIGRFSSHGNKKHKMNKIMARDRKRKREQLLVKEFSKQNLLW